MVCHFDYHRMVPLEGAFI